MNAEYATQFKKLLDHAIAENDMVLFNLLSSQQYHPRDWGDFLVDAVLALSLLNKDLHERLADEVMRRPPAPIYMSREQYVPDGARVDDYPVAFTPDGSWPDQG